MFLNLVWALLKQGANTRRRTWKSLILLIKKSKLSVKSMIPRGHGKSLRKFNKSYSIHCLEIRLSLRNNLCFEMEQVRFEYKVTVASLIVLECHTQYTPLHVSYQNFLF